MFYIKNKAFYKLVLLKSSGERENFPGGGLIERYSRSSDLN